MGEKRRQLLGDSWAALFRDELLHKLPVEKLAAHFTADFGRPSKDLTTCLAGALFQQIFDLTDIQTQEKLAFDIQWHYALDLPEKSDKFKYFSLKTIWNVRQTLIKNEIDKEMFKVIGDRLAEIFKVNTDMQRIDSVHIKSNMRKLGRINIVVQTIKKFLRNLKRQDKEAYQLLESDLIDKYTSKQKDNVFSRVKPSESSKTLKEVCQDLLYLVEHFQNDNKIGRMNSYQLMERLLDEQCHLNESDGEQQVEVKKPQEISSDSLQNSSDPDASYDGHKGQGYQVQVMETYHDNQEEEEEKEQNETSSGNEQEKNLNLVTHVEVEPAHKNDSEALLPAIESTDKRGLKPKEIGADAAYGGDENVEQAREQDVEVIAPLKGRPKESDQIDLAEHEFNSENELVECVEGEKPVKQRSNGDRHSSAMEKEVCDNCNKQNICSICDGVKYYYFRYTNKDLRVSRRRVYEKTKDFKDKYRYRAGVEATMSEYDRKTGVKQLRVRGMPAVRFAAVMKAIGINIFRAVRYKMAKKTKKRVIKWANCIISVVKEHTIQLFDNYFDKIINFKKISDFNLFLYQF
ncbi:MAG: transposase [Bacteroidales bacterium]